MSPSTPQSFGNGVVQGPYTASQQGRSKAKPELKSASLIISAGQTTVVDAGSSSGQLTIVTGRLTMNNSRARSKSGLASGGPPGQGSGKQGDSAEQ